MKSLYKIFFTFIISVSLTSCVEEWDSEYTDGKLQMNVYIVAYADSIITGHIMPVVDYLSSLNGLLSPMPNGNITRIISAEYSLNDGELQRFEKNVNHQRLDASPDFTAGDKISINLSGYYYQDVTASVIVPDMPSFETEDLGTIIEGSDTLRRIKVRIKDDANETNYYMFNAISYGEYLYESESDENGWLYKAFTGYFRSDNTIFIDNEINRTGKVTTIMSDDFYDKRPKNFSNIFSDKLFNGKECEFIIECPQILARKNDYSNLMNIERYIEIELMALSKSFYDYWKTWEHCDINTSSTYYFSAVNGGMGVLGAVNTAKRIRIDFKE